jgi:hypothetical protein
LYYEPTDSVKHIVEKLAKIVGKPADDVRFVLNDTPVDDSKTCTAASFVSDGVIYFVFREGGSSWENVKVPKVDIEQ